MKSCNFNEDQLGMVWFISMLLMASHSIFLFSYIVFLFSSFQNFLSLFCSVSFLPYLLLSLCSPFFPDFGISMWTILANFDPFHCTSFHLVVITPFAKFLFFLFSNFIWFDPISFPECLFHFVLWFQDLNTSGGSETLRSCCVSPWRHLRWISIPDWKIPSKFGAEHPKFLVPFANLARHQPLDSQLFSA